MDQTRLDEIRARCEAATPGPWNAIDKGNTVPSYAIRHFAVGEKCVNVASGISPKTGDADFIAHARTDVPDMLDEIERLTADLAAMTADRDEWRRRAEAAEDDLNHIAQEMFSDNSDDLRGAWYPCEVCKKYDGGKDCYDCLAASYDESKPGVAFEWRGPEEDKHGTA